jgi:hypothetical protein
MLADITDPRDPRGVLYPQSRRAGHADAKSEGVGKIEPLPASASTAAEDRET